MSPWTALARSTMDRPAAPVLKGASQGAEDGEMGSGNPLRASPKGGRQ
jgi:hypothetical protein